ncbi:hypothetical protein YC2023_070587 [Brassica napus]
MSLLYSYSPYTSTALFLMKGSEFYVSPDSGNDDPVTPRLGMFIHVVVQDESLCIIKYIGVYIIPRRVIEIEDDDVPRREAEFSVTQEDITEKMKTSFTFLLYGRHDHSSQ